MRSKTPAGRAGRRVIAAWFSGVLLRVSLLYHVPRRFACSATENALWPAVRHLAALRLILAHQTAARRRRLCHLATILKDREASGQQAQSLEGGGSIENEKAGRLALFDAIAILDTQSSGRIGRNQIE